MIEIKRRLHDGIYRSQGGGEERVLQQWNTNARNLVTAAKLLPEIRRESVEAYGNVGCGACWIEVDGVAVDGYEIDDINVARVERDQEARNLRMPTATQYAAKLLAML